MNTRLGSIRLTALAAICALGFGIASSASASGFRNDHYGGWNGHSHHRSHISLSINLANLLFRGGYYNAPRYRARDRYYDNYGYYGSANNYYDNYYDGYYDSYNNYGGNYRYYDQYPQYSIGYSYYDRGYRDHRDRDRWDRDRDYRGHRYDYRGDRGGWDRDRHGRGDWNDDRNNCDRGSNRCADQQGDNRSNNHGGDQDRHW